MTVTVRIDDELLALLDREAAGRGADRSDIIRRALRDFCTAGRGATCPATLAGDLLGCVRGGRPGRSRTPKATLARLIREGVRGRAH